MATVRTKEPFRFHTRLNLSELTGRRAATLSELLEHIKKVPGPCIYHHTHRFLQQHQYLSPEPPNDFAYWVAEVLGEEELGERLASIDTVEYSSIRALRDEIIATIEDYIEKKPKSKLKFADPGEDFHFIKSISFVISTRYVAYDLREFVDVMNKITLDSIYFHVFEARLRLARRTNDFSNWIETAIGDKQLADEISKLDPYTHTMEDLRKSIVRILQKRMSV
ncbi:MAG: DUF5752 family protein [Candidatus Eisenbacteria bacterium]